MNRFLVAFSLLLISATACLAAAKAKVESPADCQNCGMNRTSFGYSRMIVSYRDGSSTGTCSINCVAVDMRKSRGKEAASFQVADYKSRNLVDARSAVWVIGGSRKGVMTPVAKWAFAEKSDAEKFIRENGGKLATFDDVLQAVSRELDSRGAAKEHGGHKI
jgi:nitrous oxide reductase accessory protein NosL